MISRLRNLWDNLKQRKSGSMELVLNNHKYVIKILLEIIFCNMAIPISVCVKNFKIKFNLFFKNLSFVILIKEMSKYDGESLIKSIENWDKLVLILRLGNIITTEFYIINGSNY